MTSIAKHRQNTLSGRFTKLLRHNWQLFLLLLPGLVWLIIFCYKPMYGVTIAFKQYNPRLGIMGSKWVGLKFFEQFFSTNFSWTLIENTLRLSVMQLLLGFPAPILFALLLNQLTSTRLKKTVQTVSFAPHFISTVVLVSMMNIFLQPDGGFINGIVKMFNEGKPILFTTRPQYFRPLYVISGIWQSMGYSAIIYISALTAVDPQLHEAATMDGASKLQRVLNIDLPAILPTIATMFILAVGKLFSVGYEKVYLMQDTMNLAQSEIISTYVYKVGIQNAQHSYSVAIGLFNSVINLILLLVFNALSRKVTDTSLF